MNKIVLGILLLLLVGAGAYIITKKDSIINLPLSETSTNEQISNNNSSMQDEIKDLPNSSSGKNSLQIVRAELNQGFDLKIGEVAQINNQNIAVKFDKVYPVGGGTGPEIFHYAPMFTFIIDNQSYDESQTKYRIKSESHLSSKDIKSIHLSVMTIENYCSNEVGPEPEAVYGCFRNAARDLRNPIYCSYITDSQRKKECNDLVRGYLN